VVTGRGRGLGLGISNALLEAGADVVVFGRSPMPVELIKHAAELGREVHHVALDLADSDAIAATVRQTLTTHRVDSLVNNAGTQDRYPALDFPPEAWDTTLDIIAAELPGWDDRPRVCREQGRHRPADKGVVQRVVGPGRERQHRRDRLHGHRDERGAAGRPGRLEQLSARIPAGRWGQPQDIGNLVVFLASAAAGYVHGQVLAVDGGWMAR
jgi:2-deoxy-D-gluconate 3-dehydrogenase